MPLNDTFPPRNLPDGATEWGRTVETEVRLSQSDLVQLQQSVSGQNRTTAANLGELARQIDTLATQQEALAEQQADVLGRVSYAWPETGTQGAYSGAGTWTNSNLGVSRSFTLNEPRTVSVTILANVWVSATTGTSGSSSGAINISARVNGTIPTDTEMRFGTAYTASTGSNTSSQVNTMVTARGVLTLPAGDNVIQPLTTLATITTGGTGIASIIVEAVSVFVDVLVPA